MDDWERRQKLEEALRHAVKHRAPTPAEQRTARHAARRMSGRAMATVALVLGWALLAWIWLARPAFIFGPGDPPPPSAELREARLRFAIYLERGRVEAYVAARGRLPVSLAQAGPVEAGVFLEKTTTGYVITGISGDLALRLTDRMRADSFLGESLEILRQ